MTDIFQITMKTKDGLHRYKIHIDTYYGILKAKFNL